MFVDHLAWPNFNKKKVAIWLKQTTLWLEQISQVKFEIN